MCNTNMKKSPKKLRANITQMQVASQLALFLENAPGTLASVCSAISAANINIYAISTSDTIDHSVIRLIVDSPKEAERLFEKRGTLVVKTDVILIDGSNEPGSLAEIARRLADVGINIEYAYCATSPNATRGLLVLRPSNVPKALKILNTK